MRPETNTSQGMKLKHTFGIPLLPLLLLACTFEPEENYVEISNVPTVSLNASQLNIQNLLTLPDTFDIYARSTYLLAKLDFENEALVHLEVRIDDKHVKAVTADSILFQLDAPDYADGYHNITVYATTNSGTGSLADKALAEPLTWERSWTFLVERFAPPAIKISRAGPEDGRLSIEWEPSDVKTEKLVEIEYIRANEFPIKWSYLVADPEQTKLFDTRFVEGGLKVTVTNQSIDPVVPSPSDVYTATYNFPQVVHTSWDGQGNVVLKWTRSLFYRNVAKYSVDYDNLVVRNHSGADTVIQTDKIPFWGIKQIVFRTVAKDLIRNYQDTVKLRVVSSISVGENIGHRMSESIFAPDDPSLGFSVDITARTIQVLTGDQVTTSFDMDTLTANIFKKDLTISNDGAYLYFAYNGNVIRMDRSGNGVLVFNTRTVYGQKMDISHLSLGADRYLCFDNKKYANTLNVTSYMFDLETSEPLWNRYDSDTFYNLENFIRQTPDGKYLVLHDNSNVNILTLENGMEVTSKTIELSNNNPLGSFFNTASDDKLLLANSYRVAVYDPETDNLTERMIPGQTINYGVTFTYDPVNGNLGYSLGGYFYVIDPLSATVLRKIPVEPFTTTFTLYNGSLYSGLWKYDLNFD